MNDLTAVETIFLAASEKATPEECAAYLDQACHGDAELRCHVERLLKAQPKVGSFLAAPAATPAATSADGPIAERPGSVIGPYKLKELIGEGGMGLVFVAEQREPVRRKVALKVIKPGMDTRDVIARFEAERQALALMDHPNIARVLDAGATDSGRPYFVMELVKGIPITDYCDEHALTPRERLQLFINVCQAVQHAHQKGVIHRDLKPSNVLVAPHDGAPVVKVIDFGVAKAISQPLTDKSIYTSLSQMIGTPMYMSPEQAEINALDVDTRSDIYGLGVLLYELLTGTTPFDRQRLQTAAFDEMRRIIREEEPPRPSTRLTTLGEGLSVTSAKRKTEPAKLAALFKGDLDWIVMRALEKDRTRRYETASAMAADVRRFMAEEPIEARPPSAWYRIRKTARRNKAAMTTAAVVAAALLVGTAVSIWQAVRATRAEERALTERDNAEVAREGEQEERQKANLEKERAERARQDADEQRNIAQANEYKTEWALYPFRIASAQRAWDTNDMSRFYRSLEQCRPDFRGWEHDYLYTLANRNQQTLRGHSGPVISMAVSLDGKHLASASASWTGGDKFNDRKPGELKLWDAVTGRLLRAFKRQTGAIHSLAFSPDGKRLASASFGIRDSTYELILWDAASGEQIWTVPAGPYCVAFSPDGKRLASASSGKVGTDSGVRVWDAASGEPLLTLAGHRGALSIISVAFSPDSRRLASASTDMTVKLWELASGQEYLTLKGHASYVTSVTFSPDNKRLATASQDKTVKLWDASTGRELKTFKDHDSVISGVAFSPDGKRLVSAGGQRRTKDGDALLKLWDTDSGLEIQTLKGHGGGVTSVAFSPDGNRLVSASHDKTVKLWEIGNGQDYLTIKAHSTAVTSMAFSPDGKRLASASRDKTLKLWDPATGKELLTFQDYKDSVWSLAFSPDGKRLASASRDGTVKLWDAASGHDVHTLHTSAIAFGRGGRPPGAMAFSPDGKRLASVSSDTGKLWDADSGLEIKTLNGHQGAMAFSPDCKRLASALPDNTIKVWDLTTGKEIATLPADDDVVWSVVAFSPDGKRLASASWDDGTVKLWEVASSQKIHTLEGHTSPVTRVAFSPDGKRLISVNGQSSKDAGKATLKLWDTASGQEILTLKGAIDLAISPDGKSLARASSDKTVKLWDAPSGEEMLTLRSTHAVTTLTFSPDGKRLAGVPASPLGVGEIIIWDASKSMKELEQK
jgi:WD40 repeat protein/serine/threonine protein kinase